MDSGKEILGEVGPWAALFLTLAGLWWRLTAKFARKDLVKVQLKAITDTAEGTKGEIIKLWEVVTEAKDSSNRCKIILEFMSNNQRKRRGD